MLRAAADLVLSGSGSVTTFLSVTTLVSDVLGRRAEEVMRKWLWNVKVSARDSVS